jgi:hypothetical protein
MKLTSLVSLFALLALSTGCAVAQAPPPKSAAPQEEPVVVVETPNSDLLPGGSAFEWAPTDQPMRVSSDGAIPATSLSAQKSSRGGHLKKRAPQQIEE